METIATRIARHVGRCLAILGVFAIACWAPVRAAYADEGGVTRAAWLGRLVDTFDITVDEEEYPDEYYTDLDPDDASYATIMRAVDFGIVDDQSGTEFRPNDPATREFAAHTLNYCLGFFPDEGTAYTYSDSAAAAEGHRGDLQVAVNRKWFSLTSGKVNPGQSITQAEANAMIADATGVWHSTDKYVSGSEDIVFKSTVKVVKRGAKVTVSDDEGKVTITSSPVTLAKGDVFAVYATDVPSAYKVASVSTSGTQTVVTTQAIDPSEAFERFVVTEEDDIDLSGFEATDGAEVQFLNAQEAAEDDGLLGAQSVSFQGGKLKFSQSAGVASFDGEVSGVKSKWHADVVGGDYYARLSGKIGFTASIKGSGSATIPVGFATDGVWSFEVNAVYKASGKISKTQTADFEVGVQYSRADGFRTVKDFRKAKTSLAAQATARAGIEVKAACKVPALIDVQVGAGFGAESSYAYDEWGDGKAPYACENAEMHLYAEAFASAKFGSGKLIKPYSNTWPVWDANTSPVRVAMHREDGVQVASCTRGHTMGWYRSRSGYGSRYGTLSFGGDGSSWGYNAAGEWVEYATYEYDLDDEKNATITKYHGNTRVLIIPDTIDGHKVVGIGYGAFEKNGYLASVSIPDAVAEIGGWAFSGCKALAQVGLPASLKVLGSRAFGDCDLISSIEVPASIESCGYDGTGPFAYCDGLKQVSFAGGCKWVPECLLAKCPGIESVTVPEGVTSVGRCAFADCKNLASVSLPSTLTSIGVEAFGGCTSLAATSIPDAVTEIGTSAFEGSGLESISLPPNVAEIGGWAFSGCAKLKTAVLPDALLTLNRNTFSDCTALESVTLPKNLKTIDSNTFKNCAALKEISLPETVERIYSSAFENCDALTKVVVPNSVVSLGSRVFYDCDRLVDVTLGTGINEVPSEAFRHCDTLPSIVIPFRVTKIGANAFAECTKLASVTIPRTTTSVAANAFSYPEKMTIHGVEGTYAQTFANERGIAFNAIVVEATSITPSSTEITLRKGDSATVTAKIEPADFTGEVSWKSGNTAIATVDANGKITAKGVGSTTVKLVVGNKAASVKVSVIQGVTSVSLNKGSLSLAGGETFQLTANVYPNDANDKSVAWTSSDASVASVDENGLVTAVKKGSATITCAAQDGSGKKATCAVTVTSSSFVVTDVAALESPHPYDNRCSDTWTYTAAAGDEQRVTFDERTNLEEGSDYLRIFDGEGNEVGTYTGAELAGQTVTVPGRVVRLRLESDESLAEWGFKVTRIVAGGSEPSLDKDGWVDLASGEKGYARGGKLVTGWFDLGTSKYYFQPDGSMSVGWTDVVVDGKVMHYYFNPASGNLVRDTWFTIEGVNYYFRPSGNLATGWATIDDNGTDKKYYFREDGSLVKGTWYDVVNDNGVTNHYYFRPAGSMATGWATIEGRQYFFRPSGNMATGWADVTNDNGVTAKHYFDAEGVMVTGWQQIGPNTYYFRPSGAMQTGTATIDGRACTFTDKGVLVS